MLQKSYSHHNDLSNHHGTCVSQLTIDMFTLVLAQSPPPFLFHDLPQDCIKNSQVSSTCGAGTAHPSGAPEFTSGFSIQSKLLLPNWSLWVIFSLLLLILIDVLDVTVRDKVCQWLAAGWWFSPDIPAYSTTKHEHHEIT